MPSTLVECFELLLEAEQLAPRLDAAGAALAQLPNIDEELRWLEAARARLATVSVTSQRALLDRALRLVELESLKPERGKHLQVAVADEIERLQAGIGFTGGARSPLLEVVFANLKVPTLRKCNRTELDRFCAELERRLASSYARRILATERYQPVLPTLQGVASAIATWRSVFIEPPIEGDAAARLREELAAAGAAAELAVRQARLLAQAALLPAAELLDWAGLPIPKAKRRGKDLDPDSHPLLEHDPPDPLLPTAAERAEIAALDG